MESKMLIRPFQLSDCPRLSPLYTQLGYPVDAATLSNRLSKLLSNNDYHLLVALDYGRPVGFVGFALMQMFEADEIMLEYWL